jgi:hypothetical protein
MLFEASPIIGRSPDGVRSAGGSLGRSRLRRQKGLCAVERIKPAHYCGAPYGWVVVPAFAATPVSMPYDGPEVERFNAGLRALFEDI